jgi:hypothetical protein
MLDRGLMLAEELRRTLPGFRVDFDPIQSGAFYLHVSRGDDWFTMRYFPSHRLFGVDETTEEDSFSEYYKFLSPDFDAAATELRRIIQQKSPMNGQAFIPSPAAAASTE